MQLVTVKILLIPTKEQRQAFYDSAYYNDRMYNIALQWNIDFHDMYGVYLGKYELMAELIYRRLANIRENNLHRMCNRVISCLSKRIMLEELNVTAMLKNKHLSRAIQEQLFYRTRLLLTEKARNCFIEVGLVDRYYPSSKKCSRCGYINKHLKLSDRIFICPNCGLKIDRDYNA